jgi:UDP-glucuronate 4-epimerase
MPRVLITGAAGFIGMHTAIRFLKEGWAVVGLDNLNDYYSVELKKSRIIEIEKAARPDSFEIITQDLNSNVWERLGAYKFDAVIHLAAQAGVRFSVENPAAYIQSNILGFQKVIEFVDAFKIKKFLYASSSSVYGKVSKQPFIETEATSCPESYYAATKKANELMAHAYFKTKGVTSIGLRFFTVYGPWGRPDMAPFLFANAALNNKPIKVFNYGKQKRDFTYVDDIVEGIYLLTDLETFPAESIVCNIGKGSPVELMDFISIIEKHTERQLVKELVPAQTGDVEVTYSSTELLRKLIKYEPKTSIDIGIKKFIDWYKYYYKIC